jgi:hypothetical protein
VSPLRLDRRVGKHRATDDATPEGGWRQIPPHLRQAADWSPLAPAVRQANAGTHYADRHLPAGVDDRTGLLILPPDIDLREVTR